MPEGVGYGPQYTASVGKELNIIGRHAWGNSGVVADASSAGPDSTLFDFTTGSNYLVGKLDFTNNSSGSASIYFEMLFNEQVVMTLLEGSSHEAKINRLDILLPPYTRVQVKWGSSGNHNGSALITGRIYK